MAHVLPTGSYFTIIGDMPDLRPLQEYNDPDGMEGVLAL
jgi:hypothetical protein